ncbi:MAG: hypothetical protein CSMARM5_0022 [Candidatus Parvarchaeum acidophilus ARMAN-5_'5-way FS']|jgi:uncharacterized membrane protein (UPF0127 family)|uniref:DUF192 domain-containing protein n=2 Tax=Parvarchaeum acidophilus TaxID=662761 RepID=D6GWA2_PARA5|nr:MAG: protein of unknown function DUF192 [Candidatus Parvarchaeum acidophilus ARMAN-5]EGD71917.1 MAG: hypothetical protein CSMARM5_0022 [Candidatus Parvarchaeum acidophilus ARMAN-5_'5-way FS']
MKELCDFYNGEKAVAKKVKYCRNMSSKVLGLMFVSSPMNGAFLPDVKDIHMNFVRFELRVIWLDKNFKVIHQTIARKWRLYNGPEGAKHVLELPVDNKCNIKVGDKLKIKIYENK